MEGKTYCNSFSSCLLKVVCAVSLLSKRGETTHRRALNQCIETRAEQLLVKLAKLSPKGLELAITFEHEAEKLSILVKNE